MLIYGITLIILSLVAVPSLILAKRPDAQELLDKIAPYQGWVGVVFCIWGIWGLISAVLCLSWIGSGFLISWLTLFLYSVVEATLGFILGYPLIAKYAFGKNEEAQEKGAKVLEKLVPLQGKLGILGLIVGVWCIICSFLFVVA